ncbi:MAG: transcription antitermination factor NusB [Steroidobacteraceae bacterium]
MTSQLQLQRAQRGALSVARKLAMQALYQWQLNVVPWQDLISEFSAAEEMRKADAEYFGELVRNAVQMNAELDQKLADYLDRKPALLDPIEHAVLLIAMYELCERPDVPFRVVVDQAVSLARRFGAVDGHRYVNAVLDRAARQLRPNEH